HPPPTPPPIASAMGESLPASCGAGNDPPSNVLAVTFQRRRRRLDPHEDNGSLVAQPQGPRPGHGQRESGVPGMGLAAPSAGGPPRSTGVPAELTFVATSLLAAMWASLIGSWRQARPPQRFAAIVGAALVGAGLAPLVAWLLVGGAWAGPISFRKPTTFGLSFGLTTITLAWVTGHLRISDRTRWLLLGPLAVADTYEVVWVSVQRWRGVASHFNFGTGLDTGLFLVGGAAIAVTVAVIVALTVLAFTAVRTTPSMAVAIRAGLLILLVAQG